MPRWLSRPHAAEHLDISTTQLKRLVREGKLPPPSFPLGPRMPRWDIEALDKVMAQMPSTNISDPDVALGRWLDEQRKNTARRSTNAR